MSNKNFVLKKTTPNDVLFLLHPIDNLTLTKKIHLTKRAPQVALPEAWALGVFFNAEIYNMYRKGLFTFDDNDGVVAAAQEAGVYFDDKLDFTPAKETDMSLVLETLKAGNRQNILNCIQKYGANKVKDVAFANVNDLTAAVIQMLEKLWNVQLTLNEE